MSIPERDVLLHDRRVIKLALRRLFLCPLDLSRAGLGADRFRAVGYGETQPKFANDTKENKRRNRRIEFAVLGG